MDHDPSSRWAGSQGAFVYPERDDVKRRAFARKPPSTFRKVLGTCGCFFAVSVFVAILACLWFVLSWGIR